MSIMTRPVGCNPLLEREYLIHTILYEVRRRASRAAAEEAERYSTSLRQLSVDELRRVLDDLRAEPVGAGSGV